MSKIWAIGTLLMIAVGGVVMAFSGSGALDFTPSEWIFTVGISFFVCWIVVGLAADLWRSK